MSSTPFKGLGFTAASLSEFSGAVRNGNRSTVYLMPAGTWWGEPEMRGFGGQEVCVHACESRVHVRVCAHTHRCRWTILGTVLR